MGPYLLELQRSYLARKPGDKTRHLPGSEGVSRGPDSAALGFAIVLSEAADWVRGAPYV